MVFRVLSGGPTGESEIARTEPLTGTNDWTRVEFQFNTGQHAPIKIDCLFGGLGKGTGKAWFDQIEIKRVSEDAPSDKTADLKSGDNKRVIASPNSRLYVVNHLDGGLYRIDTKRKPLAVEKVADLGDPFRTGVAEGMTMGTDGFLYIAVNIPGSESNLYRVDPSQGEVNPIGKMGEKNVDGLDFGPGGKLYCVTSNYANLGGSNLYIVDVKTGQATHHNRTLFSGLDSLVFDDEKKAIVADGNNYRDFFRLQLFGEPTRQPIAPMPLFPRVHETKLEGIAFGADGLLYGAMHSLPSSQEKCWLIWINLKTLEYNNLGDLGFMARCLAAERSPSSD